MRNVLAPPIGPKICRVPWWNAYSPESSEARLEQHDESGTKLLGKRMLCGSSRDWTSGIRSRPSKRVSSSSMIRKCGRGVSVDVPAGVDVRLGVAVGVDGVLVVR